jgi:hypothetical protein
VLGFKYKREAEGYVTLNTENPEEQTDGIVRCSPTVALASGDEVDGKKAVITDNWVHVTVDSGRYGRDTLDVPRSNVLNVEGVSPDVDEPFETDKDNDES